MNFWWPSHHSVEERKVLRGRKLVILEPRIPDEPRVSPLTPFRVRSQRLRIKAKPVLEVTDETRQLIDDMLETMYAAPGIGLAATQVNIPQRVLVLDLSEEKNEPLALINPELLYREGEEETEEGCLSVPGVFEKVKRAEKIKIKALNREGATQEFEAEGLLAVCIQHEMDHLEGKLFVDLLSPLKRQLARKKARKEQRQRESGVSSSKSGSGP